MSTCLHVVRKDLRNFWPLLLAASLYVTFETLGWTSDFLFVRYQYAWLNLGPDALFLAVCLVAFVVVQADLTVGDRAFWRTRPIGPLSLLAAKILLLFLVFVAPAVLVNTYLAIALNTPWRVTLGIFLETTGFVALGALSAAFIASITRNLLQAAVAAVGASVVIAYSVALAAGTQTSNPNLALLPWALDQEYPGPRIVAAGFFGAIALALLLAHQFTTRRTFRTVMLIFVAVPVALLCTQLFPIDILSGPTRVAVREPGTEHFADAKIKFTGIPVVGYRSHMYLPKTSTQVKSLSIDVGANLEGVQIGRILDIESIDTLFKTKDGKEYTFTPQRQRYWPVWSEDRLRSAICLYLGLKNPPPEKHDPNFGSLTLFELPETTAQSLAGKSGTLVATMTMSERSFSMETSLPTKEGAKWSHDGQAWVLYRILPNFNGPNILALDIRHYRATSMLVPEGEYRPDFIQNILNRGFVLVNEQRGEYAIGRYMNNGRFGEPGMLATEQLTIAFSELRTPNGVASISSIDAAWLAKAKLVILQSVRLQTFQKKLRIDDFEMPEIDEAHGSPPPFWE